MGRLIEQQAVIDCLTNTAEYYDMPQADEWTKGIHYGLLHGVDNILDNVPPVEAIPKADYENRLKADLKAILVELQLEIEEHKITSGVTNQGAWNECIACCSRIIQQKINELEGYEEPITIKNDCEHCAKTYGTLGCCSTVSNEWVYSCKEGHEEYARGMRKFGTTTKNDLRVDCVARQDVERFIEGFINEYTPEEELEFINLELDGLKHLPPVTPQEPKTGYWMGSSYDYICSNCEHSLNDLAQSMDYISFSKPKYCPNCVCRMIEPQESEDTD